MLNFKHFALIALLIPSITCGLAFALVVRAQTTPPTITAYWTAVNTAHVAWSAGGCVDQQRGSTRTRVACTDADGSADVSAQTGDHFILEYNDSAHGRGEVETILAAFCGVFVPNVVR